METLWASLKFSGSDTQVLILPMRNGNRQFDPNTAEFEECSYPTYEEWKLETATVSYNCWSTFLSYLWGMETQSSPVLHYLLPCSYPTYEEWKQPFIHGYVDLSRYVFLSYLWVMETYKIQSIKNLIQRSYPTYEEWKLSFFACHVHFVIGVLILPMRNGN